MRTVALSLWNNMPNKKVTLDGISYSAAISALENVTPNEISYNAAISACENGGQWQLALSLLISMPNMKVTPDEINYHAKEGQWHLALSPSFEKHAQHQGDSE